MVLGHEDSQEGVSKDNYLDDLISEIDELLERDGALNKFQSQFDNFCLMVENYGTELDKYRQAAKERFNEFGDKNLEVHKLLEGINQLSLDGRLERLTEIRKLYINQCKTPPTDNPTWVLHGSMSDYITEDNFICSPPLVHRPSLLELPQNPVFWFLSEMGRCLSYIDPIKQPDEKELLMCDFVRLAIINDESCSYNKSIMVYKNRSYEGKFKRNSFAKDLWEVYKNPKTDDFKKTHKRALKQAMEHVKANLGQDKTDIHKEHTTEKGRVHIENLNAEHVSLGDNARHDGGDININASKPEKKWHKMVVIVAAFATILTFLIGNNICSRLKTKPQSNNLDVNQIETPNASGNHKLEISAIDVSTRDPLWGYESFDDDEVVVQVSGRANLLDVGQTTVVVAFWRLANAYETNWHAGRRRDGGNYTLAILEPAIVRAGTWDFLVGGIECKKTYEGDVAIVLLLYPESIVQKQSYTWTENRNGWGFRELPDGYLAVSAVRVFRTRPTRK